MSFFMDTNTPPVAEAKQAVADNTAIKKTPSNNTPSVPAKSTRRVRHHHPAKCKETPALLTEIPETKSESPAASTTKLINWLELRAAEKKEKIQNALQRDKEKAERAKQKKNRVAPLIAKRAAADVLTEVAQTQTEEEPRQIAEKTARNRQHRNQRARARKKLRQQAGKNHLELATSVDPAAPGGPDTSAAVSIIASVVNPAPLPPVLVASIPASPDSASPAPLSSASPSPAIRFLKKPRPTPRNFTFSTYDIYCSDRRYPSYKQQIAMQEEKAIRGAMESQGLFRLPASNTPSGDFEVNNRYKPSFSC